MPMPDAYSVGEDEVSEKDDSPMEEEDEGEATALLPKSILGGKEFKPGEEVVLQIKAVYDDEVEVAYAKEKKDDKEDMSMDKETKPMSESMKKMDEMMY